MIVRVVLTGSLVGAIPAESAPEAPCSLSMSSALMANCWLIWMANGCSGPGTCCSGSCRSTLDAMLELPPLAGVLEARVQRHAEEFKARPLAVLDEERDGAAPHGKVRNGLVEVLHAGGRRGAKGKTHVVG